MNTGFNASRESGFPISAAKMPRSTKYTHGAAVTVRSEGNLSMIPPVILLITGDAEIERDVVVAADRTGHALNVARTANEAVRMFAQGFDGVELIFVDLDPDVHGVTLFSAIEDCHGAAPIVAVTGCEESYMTPIAAAHGAACCLGKPLSATRFERLIGKLCPATPC